MIGRPRSAGAALDVREFSSFRLETTEIGDCVVIRPRIQRDARGHFVKIFQHSAFRELGLRTDFVEEYYSVSRRGVLRGLHCQLPPHAHAKLVYCVAGTVMDVGLDLRRVSPTYRQHIVRELSAENGAAMYLPAGMAHGFYVRSEAATLIYKVTSEYAPLHDTGVRWDTAGISWPEQSPTVSERDSLLPSLDTFESPF